MATKAAAKKAARHNPHTKSTQKVDGMDKMNKLPAHNGPPGVGDRADIKVASANTAKKKTAAPPAKKLSTDERLDRLEAANRALKAKLRIHGIHIEGLDGETV